MNDVRHARSAIESLRSGVPSKHAVEQLGTTQTELLEAFAERVRLTIAGQPAAPLVVTATFGAGKSHLLSCLQTLALKDGFVTSYVVVSPEMPLGNAHAVLRAIAENAIAPGRTGVALRALASDLRTDTDSFARLRLWARDSDICDRFRALLHIYEEFGADPELRMQILGDLEGKPLTKTVIRQKLREIGELAGYDMQHPRNALLAHDRLQVYAKFAVACGCKGLVVLFDELERISRFTARQRMAAYGELGWWLMAAQAPDMPIIPVFADNLAHLQEVLIHDQTRVLPGFGQGLFDDDKLAASSQQAIEMIDRQSIPLRSPTDEEKEQIRYRVKDIYQRAYDCQVPSLQLSGVSTTIRSDIRRWITLWDMHRYYPEYQAEPIAEDVSFDESEIGESLASSDEEAERE